MSISLRKKELAISLLLILLIVLIVISALFLRNYNNRPIFESRNSNISADSSFDKNVNEQVKNDLIDFTIKNVYYDTIKTEDFKEIIVVKDEDDWSEFNSEYSTNYKNIYYLYLKEKDKSYGDGWQVVTIDLDNMEIIDSCRTEELPEGIK